MATFFETTEQAGARSSPGDTGRTVWRPSNATLRVRATGILMLVDLLCILVVFVAVAALRGEATRDAPWLSFVALLLPVHAVTAIAVHAYGTRNLQDPFHAIRKGEQALAIAIALVTLQVFYTKSGDDYSRAIVAAGSIGSVLALAIGRYNVVRHLQAIVGGNPFSVVCIHDGVPVPSGAFSVVMAAESYFDPECHDPVMYDRLASSLQSADRVVIACKPERRIAWAGALRGANIQGEILMPELVALAPLGMGPSRNTPSIVVALGPLSLSDRLFKRSFDLAMALPVLLLLLPLLGMVALLIKLDSRGTVFFSQTRIGRGNQMFRMFKFRSMHGGDGAGNRSAARDDDRITRVGRFIRSTSIDELPQLFNVLKGDMSIVGPRPHALGSRAADKLFWEVDQRYWDRHAAKPGLTGLAQIRGFRGATVFEDDLRNRLQADLEYLENWSIWRDLKIVFLTVRVLVHRNAY